VVSFYLSIYLTTYLSNYLSTYLRIYLSAFIPIYVCNLLIIYPSIHLIGTTSPRFARSSIVFLKVYVPMSPSGAKTHLLVCYDSFICMTWLLHVCHDSLIMHLAWFLQMCDITHACAQHWSSLQRSLYQWVHWYLCERQQSRNSKFNEPSNYHEQWAFSTSRTQRIIDTPQTQWVISRSWSQRVL